MDEAAAPAKPGKRERTRQLILETATELFDERPWDDVTMEDIADAAGLVRTTLFNHFEGKSVLLMAVCLGQLDDVRKAAERWVPAQPIRMSFSDKIWPATQRRFEGVLEALRGHSQLSALLWDLAIADDSNDVLHPVLDRFFELVGVALTQNYKGGKKALPTEQVRDFMAWQLLLALHFDADVTVAATLLDHYRVGV